MSIDLLTPPEPTMSEHALSVRRAHLLREIARPAEQPPRVAEDGRRSIQLERRPPMRAIGRRTAIAVAVAALVAVLAAVLPGELTQNKMTLIDSAIAAIGNGPTTHVVLEQGIGTRRVDFRTGKTTLVRTRIEFWFDPKLGLLRVSTLNGKPLQTIFAPAKQMAGAADWYRPFVAGYGAQLRDGAYHVVSSGRINGQTIEWIAAKPTVVTDLNSTTPHEYVQEVAISQTTFKPVYMRTRVDGVIKPDSVAHVIVAETLPRKPSLFAHRRASAWGLGITPTAPATTLRDARAAMSPDPVVPSARLAELRRRWVGLPRYLTAGNTYRAQVAGVELFYGRTDDAGKPVYSGSFISITEFPRANAQIRYQGLAMFPDNAAIISDRTATMKTHGLYVVITAGHPGEALAAARALSGR